MAARRRKDGRKVNETLSVISRLLPTVAMAIAITGGHLRAVEVFTPEEELATFQLPDGFEANLFASEELDVLNPMQMRWDEEGRLYVISTLAYPQLRPGEIPNDRIVRLTDVDGDGRADKSEIVVDGLNIPTGIELGDNGIYIGEQTDLVHFTDPDGDGKYDRREVLLSGFGVGDTHQAINSFVWSPGGELYINQGDGIESRVETPWGLSGLFQAGIMRFRPKRLRLDPFLDDFMGPGNPWGVAFDDWGQTFVIDGAGGVTFLSPAMMPVRHKRRLRRIGEPGGYCGIDVIGTQHMPDDYQGDFIVGDFQRMRIKRFATRQSGSGFTVDWKEPVMVSTHRNFRPVDVRMGPDGAIYVCDWYNSIICHQDDPFRHPDRDFTHGRIWRITNKNKPTIKRPELKQASKEQLYSNLTSPERWTRYQTKRLLARRHPVFATWLATRWKSGLAHEQNEQLLLEIVSALESVEEPDADLLRDLVGADDHRGRAYAARVAGRWHDRIPNALKVLARLAKDPHPLVRMEAVVACAHVPDARAAEVAAIVADQPMDYDLDYALSQALHHLKDHWIPAFQRGDLTFGNRPNRLAAVLERVSSSELQAAVRQMAMSGDSPLETRGAGLRALARIGNAEDLRLVLDAARAEPTLSTELLEEFEATYHSRSLQPAGELTHVGQFFERADVAPVAVRLVGLWKIEALLPELESLVSQQDVPPITRAAAIGSLGSLGGEGAEALLQKLSASKDTRIDDRFAAVAALAGLNPESAAQHALKIVTMETSAQDTSRMTNLIRAFANQQEGLRTLAGKLSGATLGKENATNLLSVLSAIGISDERLLEVLNDAAGITLDLPPYSDELLQSMVVKIDSGDTLRGAKVFHSQQTNCIKCHRIAGTGGNIGPELSGVGTTMPRDRMVQEVLWPQRHVKDGYMLEQILTEDGKVFQGYRQKSRDRQAIYLQPLDSETVLRFPKQEIDEHDEIGSAMPANIVAALTQQQRIDLLKFLSQLGTPDGITGLEHAETSK